MPLPRLFSETKFTWFDVHLYTTRIQALWNVLTFVDRKDDEARFRRPSPPAGRQLCRSLVHLTANACGQTSGQIPEIESPPSSGENSIDLIYASPRSIGVPESFRPLPFDAVLPLSGRQAGSSEAVIT